MLAASDTAAATAQRVSSAKCVFTCLVQRALGFIAQAPAVPSEHENLKEMFLHPGKHPQPRALDAVGPAYTFDLVRNGTSGGPWLTNPQIPSVTQDTGRMLAETGSFAAGTPLLTASLDSVVTTGSEAVYMGGDGGTIDGTVFYNSFTKAYFNPAITKFRIPTGTYRVANTTGNFNLFVICQALVRSHFEVDFGGSTIIFQVCCAPHVHFLHAHAWRLCDHSPMFDLLRCGCASLKALGHEWPSDSVFLCTLRHRLDMLNMSASKAGMQTVCA